MFGPLVDQMIHWFSRPQRRRLDARRQEGECLLTAILSSLEEARDEGHGGQAAAAGHLREFFKWSVKQNSDDMIKVIVKRLCSMWVHPADNRRHAASVAFNHIYVAFR